MKLILQSAMAPGPLLALLTLLLAGCSEPRLAHTAEEGAVRISLSTNRVLLGDVFQAELEVEHPASAVVTPPSIDRGNELTVLHREVATDPAGETTSVTRLTYHLQSFSVGVYDLTTNALSIRLGADTRTLPLPDLPFEVASSLDSVEETLAVLKDPVLWPDIKGNRMLWALLIVLLLALAAGIIGFLLRKSRKQPQASLAPVIPAHELALKALRDLKAEPWLDERQFEIYYVKLSDIVRYYLENRFNLHAPEQTTEEFIREAAEHRALHADQQDQVQSFLIQSDLVKFARFTPTITEADAAYDSAVRLVNETRAPEGGSA
jgi:hypothetical protein